MLCVYRKAQLCLCTLTMFKYRCNICVRSRVSECNVSCTACTVLAGERNISHSAINQPVCQVLQMCPNLASYAASSAYKKAASPFLLVLSNGMYCISDTDSDTAHSIDKAHIYHSLIHIHPSLVCHVIVCGVFLKEIFDFFISIIIITFCFSLNDNTFNSMPLCSCCFQYLPLLGGC